MDEWIILSTSRVAQLTALAETLAVAAATMNTGRTWN
jgi:hypothetical protein